jgi:hypothetical protein
MAEHFFGYGRWDAPYWFIGPEAGTVKDGTDSAPARYESWRKLECAPVVDCEKHHRRFGFTKWHDAPLPTQPTWRQLIRLLFAYKGLEADLDDIRKYQREKWGSSDGETCVIELCGIPAPSMAAPGDRTTFLSRGIARIRLEAAEHRPEFIVMYGTGQREEWLKIANAAFDSEGLCRMGGTLAAIAPHPVTHGLSNEYWLNLEIVLRRATQKMSLLSERATGG